MNILRDPITNESVNTGMVFIRFKKEKFGSFTITIDKLNSIMKEQYDDTVLDIHTKKHISRFLSFSCLQNKEHLDRLKHILSCSTTIRNLDKIHYYCNDPKIRCSLFYDRCLPKVRENDDDNNNDDGDSDEERTELFYEFLDRDMDCGLLEKIESPELVTCPFIMSLYTNELHSNYVQFEQVNPIRWKHLPSDYVLEDIILEEILYKRWISFIYVKKPTWYIGLNERSKWLSAFFIPEKGYYAFRVLPNGSKMSEAVEQVALEEIFSKEIKTGDVCVRARNIVISNNDIKEHLDVIKRVLHILDLYKIVIDPYKTAFCRISLRHEYLDYDLLNELNEEENYNGSEIQKLIHICDSVKYMPIEIFAKDINSCFNFNISGLNECLPNMCIYASSVKHILEHSTLKRSKKDIAIFQNLKLQMITMKSLSSVQETKPFIIYSRSKKNYIIGSLAQIEFEKGYEEIHYITHTSGTFNSYNEEKTYNYVEKQIWGIIYLLNQFESIILSNPNKHVIIKFEECRCESCFNTDFLYKEPYGYIRITMSEMHPRIINAWREMVEKYKITENCFQEINCCLCKCIKDILLE